MPEKSKHRSRRRIAARVHQLSHWFGNPPHIVHVLHDIDISIRAGELMLIMGPSGSGKTTLLSILGMLLEPQQGVIEIGGHPLCHSGERDLPAIRRKQVTFVFQSFNLLKALTAAENVQIGLALQGVNRRDAVGGAMDLLERVGMTNRAGHFPNQLSAGQQQRVAIARALASPAPLLLADEPTGNLDSKSAFQVTDLLRDLAGEEQRAVVVVTHDPRLEGYADRVVRLEDGRVVDDQKGVAA